MGELIEIEKWMFESEISENRMLKQTIKDMIKAVEEMDIMRFPKRTLGPLIYDLKEIVKKDKKRRRKIIRKHHYE